VVVQEKNGKFWCDRILQSKEEKDLSSEKAAGSASIIGGADGPTSVFVLKGGKHHTTIKQKIYKIRFRIRKAWEDRRIKADPHSMEEVENVPRDSFDIDLHIFEKNDADTQMRFSVERNYGYIGGGASGSKKKMKKYKKLYRDLFRYYGVAQEDIDQKTARYETVIKTLAGR
jgi:hypothetical protein